MKSTFTRIHYIALIVGYMALAACGGGSGSSGSGSAASSGPPAVTLTPDGSNILINETLTLTAGGGDGGPYTYSIVSGPGTIDSSTGIYTAGALTGIVTVQAVDGSANSITASLTVHPVLAITPTSSNLGFGGTETFSGSGGISPYTFSVTGSGSINSLTGVYTAPLANTTDTITITDSASHTTTASVTVSNTLAINPSTLNITTNSSQTFTASGGTGPYTYSRVSGAGFLDDGTSSFACTSGCVGDYASGASPGTDVIRVTDSLSATADVSVNVYSPLSISPTSASVSANGTQAFIGSGGLGALTYSIASGLGSINSSTGVLTASATAGSVTVRVTDSIGNIADAAVTVVTGLSISPASMVMSTNSTQTFSGLLGTAPYTFSVFSGAGSIVPATGVYTAPSAAGASVVRVTDNASNTKNANVTIVSPTKILANEYITCILFSNNLLRCWGDGAYGQLGNGATTDIGGAANQMGNNNAFINVGTGKTVKDFAMGAYHVCAILNDDSVKCWGRNEKGQLGIGSTVNKGAAVNEMGDNLVAVNLGTGKTAKYIAAGGSASCAILNDNTLKCWGNNSKGNLGYGDVNHRGDAANEMGDSLAAVSLGTGRYAKSVYLSHLASTTSYEQTTCAILDNDSLKCWGGNTYGQLGTGNTTVLGDGAGEMGDALPVLNLGTNLTAKSIASGNASFCAIIHDSGATNEDKVKCWGRSNKGQLGQDLATNVNKGDGAGEMGDSLPYVGSIGTVKKLASSYRTVCAVLSNDTVKCWGDGANGQIGVGNTTIYGTSSALMSTVPAVSIGTGFVPQHIAVGRLHTCVLSTAASNLKVKCWGSKTNGALGSGDLGVGATTILGDGAGEMGDSLPFVSY